eukprot:m.109576 g.109576  ORF g.109576 m.109576 type:complete len:77 (-) comp13378_c0_seq2:691-921(-)
MCATSYLPLSPISLSLSPSPSLPPALALATTVNPVTLHEEFSTQSRHVFQRTISSFKLEYGAVILNVYFSCHCHMQ